MSELSNPASKQPNILLVVAEDMGPQLGIYGCADARTPHLDAFGRTGTTFSHAWCAFPMCSPGRSALLTGLPPHENGTMGLATCGFTTFEGVPSLPALLNEAGYRTALFGKLHVLPESRFPFHLHWKDAELSFSARNYPKMIRAVEDFVAGGTAPFFCMVALPDAHVPFLRQSFGEPKKPVSGAEVGIVPGMDRVVPELAEWYADYHNCIARADTAFGGLLEMLGRIGRRDNTLVIFTADHGLQFPRGKLSVYEPGLCIPLLVGGTGWESAPRRVTTPAGQTDVCAEILAAAGLPLPAPASGVALRKLAETPEADRLVFGEITACSPRSYFPQRAVRDQRHKLIWSLRHGEEMPYYRTLLEDYSSPGLTAPPDPPNSSDRPPIPPADSLGPDLRRAYATWRRPPEFELYDLLEDPLETVNRSGDPALADVENKLRHALRKWQEDTDDFVLDPGRLGSFEEEIRAYMTTKPGVGHENARYDWQYPSRWRPRTLV